MNEVEVVNVETIATNQVVNKEPQFVEIDMGDCCIKFYNHDGTQARTGDCVRSWNWELISDKIDSKIVRSVTIPKLTYDKPEALKILVEIEPSL